MKIPVIKKLVETHDILTLSAAEDALLNEQTPAIEIAGDDEGEQLTHVIAAIEILRDVETNGCGTRDALRNYTVRVRKSIC